MKILAIDTSTRFLCLGIYDNSKVYEYNLELGSKLSGLIIPTIARVLDAANIDLLDVDYFACGVGPGSFTGLRVGLAAVKGLAWGKRKKVIAVPTLDIISRNIEESGSVIAPIIDAKRGLFYSCFYRNNKGSYKRVSAYRLLNAQELFKKAPANSVFLGDGVGVLRDKVALCTGSSCFVDKDYWYPKAHNILHLAIEKIKRKELSDAFNIKPMYLYPKECQIRKDI